MAPMEDDLSPAGATYTTGAATLRSSAHRAVYSKARMGDRGPVTEQGNLPDAMRNLTLLDVFEIDTESDPRPAIARLLQRADPDIGAWPSTSGGQTLPRNSVAHETSSVSEQSYPKLEDFHVLPASLANAKAGSCVDAQASLAALVASDTAPGGVLYQFDLLLRNTVLPSLKKRLEACSAGENRKIKFYAQCPPTLRLQPGPSTRYVRPHCDAEYGHQDGEINFWMPLTDPQVTQVDLEVESVARCGWEGGVFGGTVGESVRKMLGSNSAAPVSGNYDRTNAALGQAASFHGSSKKHFVEANASRFTRMSLDFRIGIEGYYDPTWSMAGTKADHDRKVFEL